MYVDLCLRGGKKKKLFSLTSELTSVRVTS